NQFSIYSAPSGTRFARLAFAIQPLVGAGNVIVCAVRGLGRAGERINILRALYDAGISLIDVAIHARAAHLQNARALFLPGLLRERDVEVLHILAVFEALLRPPAPDDRKRNQPLRKQKRVVVVREGRLVA